MAQHRPPRVGDIVHYVAHGTPIRPDGTQAYPSVCRAAIVTEAHTDYPEGPNGRPHWGFVSLAVLNPSGAFFNQRVAHHAGDTREDAPGACCHTGDRVYFGGTWHVPEE